MLKREVEMEEFNKTFNKRLKFIREKLGETQESFAAKLDLSASAYKKLESGENNISIKTLYELKKMDISSDYILHGSECEFEQLLLDVQSRSGIEKMEIFVTLIEDFRNPKNNEPEISEEKMLEIIKRFIK